jgi:5-(carboxyamino)imidazole ribonucleotide synthase
MIQPGSWLGLLGGGQLGKMFTQAAQQMGYRVMVLDPDEGSPAGSLADVHLAADFMDPAALEEIASVCEAATTEFENVPAEALSFLEKRIRVSPSSTCVAIAQDRIKEKHFLADAPGVAPYAVIQAEDDLRLDRTHALFPGILKLSRLGYDGKGQARVGNRDEALQAFRKFGSAPCVLEKFITMDREVSVVIARGFEGQCVTFPVAENRHHRGILDVSMVPAHISDETAVAARRAAIHVAESLDYRGVLCVEFFVQTDGSLLANEMAPRPHNSGHYSLDASVTSQFEQQVRVMCGAPLGSTDLLRPAVMVNLLGDLWARGEPDWAGVLKDPSVKLHLYGKSEPRPGRKMGHFTVMDASIERALATALNIKGDLSRAAQSLHDIQTA